jgi:DNA-binding response OmpR family regulator
VCRQLRGLHPGSVPVILIARDDEMDTVVALDADADADES